MFKQITTTTIMAQMQFQADELEQSTDIVRITHDLHLEVFKNEVYLKHLDGNEVLLNCSIAKPTRSRTEFFDEGALTQMFVPNYAAQVIASFLESCPFRVEFDHLREFWSGFHQAHKSLGASHV